MYISYKYFAEYEADIRRQFKLKCELSEEALHRKMFIKGTRNSVAVHIRRGDYVTVNRSTLCMDYYKKAMSLFEEKLEKPIFLFFCEDINWVKNWFGENDRYFYMEPGVTDIEEFYLMQQCENAIIADSTFSWWAAWLNKHENKIIVSPRDDVGNRIPDDWIQLEAVAINVDENSEYDYK